jgi:hypothetical protein
VRPVETALGGIDRSSDRRRRPWPAPPKAGAGPGLAFPHEAADTSCQIQHVGLESARLSFIEAFGDFGAVPPEGGSGRAVPVPPRIRPDVAFDSVAARDAPKRRGGCWRIRAYAGLFVGRAPPAWLPRGHWPR